jgi:hypothetical protein
MTTCSPVVVAWSVVCFLPLVLSAGEAIRLDGVRLVVKE